MVLDYEAIMDATWQAWSAVTYNMKKMYKVRQPQGNKLRATHYNNPKHYIIMPLFTAHTCTYIV